MSSDPLLGRVIDHRYRIDAEIGAGGMATIYRATRLQIGDTVAIKVLHPELLRDPKFAERFQREAQAAARLKHPNVVAIHDFGVSEDNLIYLVMELVEGQNLRIIIKEEGPMTIGAAAAITRQVCAALTEAHRQNVMHRDIKPANIAVESSPDGIRVKVLDFGIASLGGGTMLTLTQTGTMLGTPAYMSPEQCMGEELDSRTDIYSLGVVLFEMLSGVVPFNSPTATATAVVMQHVQQAPPALRVLNASVPAPVEAVVLRALAKRREDRPQTAREFADDLSAAAAGVAAPLPAAKVLHDVTEPFSRSQVARTMVQTPTHFQARPSGMDNTRMSIRVGVPLLIVSIVALIAAAVLGMLWIGAQRSSSGRAPSSQTVAAKPLAHHALDSVPNGTVRGLVQEYYKLWNAHDLAGAYGLLSPRYRALNPYEEWKNSHATVVAIGVATYSAKDPMTVNVVINSIDRVGGGTKASEYKGTWTAVYKGGRLRLDSVALDQTK